MSAGNNLTLRDHLAESCIHLGIEVREREEVLTVLAGRAESAGMVRDGGLFLTNLKAREAEMSTGVGRGIAVPHAEVAGAEKTFVTAATLSAPIAYPSMDDQPVDVIFMIGGRPGEVGLHLQLLARIARLARNDDFLKRLRGQKTAAGFIAVVADAESALYG